MSEQLDCGYPSLVEDWNAQYPPGTPVMYWTGFREQEGAVGLTRSEARLMGDNPVVWVTGHGACIALTHVAPITTQRRALLAHLLQSEGLPGVEDIDAKYLLRKMEKVGMENVYLSQRNQELWAENERLREENQRLWSVVRERQFSLEELLEAEARERVERSEETPGLARFLCGSALVYFYSETGRIAVKTYNFDIAEDLQYCLAAALAEKRRREGEVL